MSMDILAQAIRVDVGSLIIINRNHTLIVEDNRLSLARPAE